MQYGRNMIPNEGISLLLSIIRVLIINIINIKQVTVFVSQAIASGQKCKAASYKMYHQFYRIHFCAPGKSEHTNTKILWPGLPSEPTL